MGMLEVTLAIISFSVLLSIVGSADGQITLLNSTFFQNNVSSACSKALTSKISCPVGLVRLTSENYFGNLPTTSLDELCTSNCSSSLASYHSAVVSACKNDPQPYNGFPASYAGDSVWAYRNTTCLKDTKSGQYCVNIMSNWTIPSNVTQLQQLPQSQLCSPCLISAMVAIEKTPYSDYNTNISSQWAAAQKICSVSYPTSVQQSVVTGHPQQPVVNYTAKGTQTCQSGNMYTVSKGDSCNSIAIAKNVATGTLQILNGIYPDCSNFNKSYIGQSICLPKTCKSYVVKNQDTCWTIAYNNTITFTQFRSYNPTIYDDCSNLVQGTNVCLTNPSGQYNVTTIPGVSVTQTWMYATSTVTPPGPTPSGTTKGCGQYYQVISGDTCAAISLNQTISPQEFEDINPSLNKDCTNLQKGLWYCVFPVFGWNTTDAHPVTTNSGSNSSSKSSSTSGSKTSSSTSSKSSS